MKKTTALIAACTVLLMLFAGCDGKLPGTSGAGQASFPAGASETGDAPMTVEDYQAVFGRVWVIITRMNDLTAESGYHQEEASSGAAPAMFQSAELTLASWVVDGEGEATAAGVAAAFDEAGYTNAAVTRGEDDSYTVTYKGGYTDENTAQLAQADYEMALSFSRAGAMRMVVTATAGGETRQTALFEFVPLSGGRYAMQSASERALAEYGDRLTGFTYVQGAYSTLAPYIGAQADAIFPDGRLIGDNWVLDKGNYLQMLEYSGDTLDIELTGLHPGGPYTTAITIPSEAPDSEAGAASTAG
jgi:hypothetical protein